MKTFFEEILKLPPDAVNWLMALYSVIQTFDDYADGDEVDRKILDSLIWNTLIELPMNPFFMSKSNALWPIVANAIMKWQASDTVERSKKATVMSFAWRAGFYDVVLMVYTLCHGREAAEENAHLIMNLYGETLEDYFQEVNNA